LVDRVGFGIAANIRHTELLRAFGDEDVDDRPRRGLALSGGVLIENGPTFGCCVGLTYAINPEAGVGEDRGRVGFVLTYDVGDDRAFLPLRDRHVDAIAAAHLTSGVRILVENRADFLVTEGLRALAYRQTELPERRGCVLQ
jgi:hypothetical protein